MKWIIKILLAPVVLAINLATWICAGLIACTSFVFQIASGILSLLAICVLITYSVKNGLILLFLAFFISPMGLPMLAVHLLTGLQAIASAIRNL